ncbi:hypothetical protein [Paenibacillus crassostreae]|uniref:Uncharacterized protein n=1 Tax=Paenibacillus crassostreae TaxID=1763538 RepID=A0A167DQX6_9BACL|nr:hypothetical protein [Paenibacillus crassostreae]AOZ91164.1 hypothetical protein LPB68_02365 [Paenibacillus crassostreae]OAB74676.1 hypothetical protein PNBC_11595 [Paenibacillus crassostreae]
MDLVLDSLGGDVQEKSYKVLREGGRLVTIIPTSISEAAEKYNIDAKLAVVQPNLQPKRNDFEQIEKMVIGVSIIRSNEMKLAECRWINHLIHGPASFFINLLGNRLHFNI